MDLQNGSEKTAKITSGDVRIPPDRDGCHSVSSPRNERHTAVQLNEYVVPTITGKDLGEVCGKIVDDKALGLDGIPNRTLKLAVKTRPDQLELN